MVSLIDIQTFPKSRCHLSPLATLCLRLECVDWPNAVLHPVGQTLIPVYENQYRSDLPKESQRSVIEPWRRCCERHVRRHDSCNGFEDMSNGVVDIVPRDVMGIAKMSERMTRFNGSIVIVNAISAQSKSENISSLGKVSNNICGNPIVSLATVESFK